MRLATKLARQRPFGAFVFNEKAAKDPRSRGAACQFLKLGHTVEREQANILSPCFRDSAFAFDCVAERKPLRGDVKAKTDADFPWTCYIKTSLMTKASAGKPVRGFYVSCTLARRLRDLPVTANASKILTCASTKERAHGRSDYYGSQWRHAPRV